jgi:chromate transporter
MSLLLRLFLIFAKIGLFTIGGGLAMLPLVQQELIAGGYMSLRESIDMLAISQMTPGPFAVNAATFSGMRLAGFAGAGAATLGVILPSFVICLLVAKHFFAGLRKPQVRAVLNGIKPVVFALILSGMIEICREAFFPLAGTWTPDIPVVAIAFVTTLLLVKTKLSPALLVLGCGVVGAVFLQ